MKHNFWATFGSFVLSFLAMRLISQTNLLMLAPLGEFALSAYAIPNRIMFIDSVIAFGIGPIASVLVSKSLPEDRATVISQIISNTFFISIITTLLCLAAYPLIIVLTLPASYITELSATAVFWLTITIAPRMLVFVATMCLFAADVRKPVVYSYLFTIVTNALFNYIFIYLLSFGFEGSYIATALVSTFEMFWLLLILKLNLYVKFLRRPDFSWLKAIWKKIGAEWIRLFSWQAEGVLTIAALTIFWSRPNELATIGVTGELTAFLLMPLIALMRSIAVLQSNPQYKCKSLKAIFISLSRPLLIIGIIYILIGLMLVIFSHDIANKLYYLSGISLDWFKAFSRIYAFALLFFIFSAIIKGWLQANDQFVRIAKFEILATWIIFIPLILIGSMHSNANIFFSALFLKELLICGVALFWIYKRGSL